MAGTYWCHMCSQTVNPVIDAEEIKCPFCQNGFVEEMSSGELNDGSSIREVQDSEIDFGTEGPLADLALWSPVLLGMMSSNPRRRSRFREFGFDDDQVNVAADGNESNVVDTHHRHHHHNRRRHHRHMHHDHDSIIRRRRRSSAAILQLVQGLREVINTEDEHSQFVRTRLAHLIEHLANNNDAIRIRHGTLPARKEAVENLPTVKICEPLQCSVCLDDFDKGSEAKEMPCKHKFHVGCIVPWLELHSSCPVCRYELPPPDDDEVKTDLVRRGTTSVEEINTSNDNVEEDARNTSGSERRFSLLWPFSWLFSSSASSSGSGSSQLNENSGSG